MPIPPTTPRRTGMVLQPGNRPIDRVGMRALNGVGYMAVPYHRPMHLAERGQLAAGGQVTTGQNYEITPAGIQPFVGWPTTSGGLTPGTEGSMAPGESTDYYVTATAYSPRYGVESNPGGVAKVVLLSGSNHDSIDVAATNCPDTVTPLTTLLGHSDNALVSDYVETIRFYRTLGADSATVADSTSEEAPKGDFYLVKEVSIHSFINHPTWVVDTPYTAGDFVKTSLASGGNPTAPTTTWRYLCLANHTSADGSPDTFTDDYDLGHWLALGGTPTYLTLPDNEIAFSHNLLSVRRQIPPDCWSIASHRGRLFYTGQTDYNLRVSMINDSPTVTLNTRLQNPNAADDPVNSRRVPDGIVGRTFSVLADGREYAVENFTHDTSFRLSENYLGKTTSTRDKSGEDAVVKASLGAIWFSDVSVTGLVGSPLPDAVPRTNVMHFEPDDGFGNEALAETKDGVLVFKRNKIGFFANAGDTPRTVETITVHTRGDRNLARGPSGEVYFISSGGIRVIDSPVPSREISGAVSDFWHPRKETVDRWALGALDRAVLIYHPGLNWLIMVGQSANGLGLNDLMLVWNRDNDEWFKISLWDDGTDGTLAFEDITGAATQLIQGRREVFLAGRLVLDADDDGLGEIGYAGRTWWFRRGFKDEVPRDKNNLWPLVTAGGTRVPGSGSNPSLFAVGSDAIDHKILAERELRPIAGGNGEVVAVAQMGLMATPSANGADYHVFHRVRPVGGGDVVRVPASSVDDTAVSLKNLENKVSPKVAPGLRVTPVLRATVRDIDSEVELREVNIQAQLRSQPGRV